MFAVVELSFRNGRVLYESIFNVNFCYQSISSIPFSFKRVLQLALLSCLYSFEQPHEKTCLRVFRPGLTQTGLQSSRRWLG